MIPLSEQYRINIKNAIELIDKTLESVEKSNVILSGKHLRDIKKTLPKITLILYSLLHHRDRKM